MAYIDYFNGEGIPRPAEQIGNTVFEPTNYVYAGAPIDIGTTSERIMVYHDGVYQIEALGQYTRVGTTINSAGWRVASGPPDNIPASIIGVIVL